MVRPIANTFARALCGLWFCLGLLLALPAAAAGPGVGHRVVGPPQERQVLASGEEAVALVEVFTSQGCSSCPPAEQWLTGWRNDPQLWRKFVPMAYHVDYWDRLGWPDPFAEASYSERQRQYRREGATKGVYTPGIVVGGSEWKAWFNGVRRPPPLRTRPGKLTAVRINNALQVEFQPKYGVRSDEQQVQVHAAILGFDLQTRVRAGENRGRTLKQDFVVLGQTQATLSADGPKWTGAIALPDSQHAAGRFGVSVWVTDGQRQQPLQAVGGWLE